MSQKLHTIIVGGGPAGIALAVELIEMGMTPQDILILEKGEAPVKAIRQFYPDKKMTLANYKNLPTETLGHIPCFPDLTKAETLTYFDELIAKYRLNYRLNSEVSKVIPEADGRLRVFVNQEERIAETVAVGIGILGRPNKPAYKIPLKLRDHVLFDLTSQPIKNCRVLVVGGGDTSSEYCQILVEEGCAVSLACRSSNTNRMMESNALAVSKLATEKKLNLMLGCEIEELQEEEARPKVIFKNSPPETYDKVVYAIGGTTPVNFLKTIGIEFDENNWPKTGESGETNIPNVYLIGDLMAGKTGGSIITAYNSSYKTALKILGKS